MSYVATKTGRRENRYGVKDSDIQRLSLLEVILWEEMRTQGRHEAEWCIACGKSLWLHRSPLMCQLSRGVPSHAELVGRVSLRHR